MLVSNKKFNKKNFKLNKQSLNDITLDTSTVKVIIFASALIVMAISLMGALSYNIAKNALTEKLKARDLIYIAQSINAKIDSRISRAKETSLLLAEDPVIVDWLQGKELDMNLGSYANKKITALARQYDYTNSFIVSALTNHYWAEDGKLIDTLSISDPDDSWFFETMSSKQPISLQIDYNKERNDTFVFVNALIGDVNKPTGITGVGLNLKGLSEEFKSYKFGEFSNMWLIDNFGDIYLSEDADQSGKNISELVPLSIINNIITSDVASNANGKVFEYKDNDGQTFDVICQSIQSTDWKLVFQIPRSESISAVDSIKMNTLIASIISIVLIVLVFYLISNKISNPYKRAIILSQELERQVSERTKELNEKNQKIMDSIEYARIIQESILPPSTLMDTIFHDYFILWKPKDTVGGDFYYAKQLNDGFIVVIGDCTGHGVPGALMSMTVNSILNHIIDTSTIHNPSFILEELNRELKQTLYGKNPESIIDDGLDAAIIYISNNKLTYAGAKVSIYKKSFDEIVYFKGNNKGIGYKNTSDSFEFNNIEIEYNENDIFYITTDGFVDQNGGEKDLPYGRKNLEKSIHYYSNQPLRDQKELFDNALKMYMGTEPQRDDITLLAFSLKYNSKNL